MKILLFSNISRRNFKFVLSWKEIKDDNCRLKKQKVVFDWKEFRTEYSFEFKLSAESSS